MFNLAIDSKLRGCDVVALKVETLRQAAMQLIGQQYDRKKTGQPVRFELTEQTRQAVDDYIRIAGKKSGEFMFIGRRDPGRNMSTRQYARLVSDWIATIGLDPHLFGTHSLRRTKATLIYRRTGNLRAVQLLLETAPYCPRTLDGGKGPLCLSPALWRDGVDQTTIDAPWR